jgi:hypothetical protein
MILHPQILALFVSSLLVCLMVLYSSYYGIRILRSWDIQSGSELQLILERRTYLISTIVSYFLVFQLASLFLFISTADSICDLFVGAMCAVGTLTVNPFGYPTLLLKLFTFLLAGFWLVLNHLDNHGYDYPLIKVKYGLLLFLAPFLIVETITQAIYFGGLKPDIITSCCGSLFSPASRSIAAEVANAPALPMLAGFYLSAAVTSACGIWLYVKESGGTLFAVLSALHFLVSLVAVVSVISLYIYRMPSHHCPFCILQKEYYFIGYPIYLSILITAICGIGAGLTARYRNIDSLNEYLPHLRSSLVLASLISTAVLAVITSCSVYFTSFTLR